MVSTLLFVDALVSNSHTLLEGLDPQVRVVYLDANRSGITQVQEALASEQNLDSIQLLSHGSQGGLQLGSDWVDSDSLETYQDRFQQWGNALKDSGDILLLGCNVGAGTQGQSFIDRLSQLTGADVAASNDLTGSAAKGGDWTLEVADGVIEAELAIQNATAYEDTLGVFNVSVATDNGNGGTVGTLSWAITQANATPEDDTIQLGTDVQLTGFSQPVINGNVNFVGNNRTVSGENGVRPFFVRSGTVSFSNMTIDKGRSAGSTNGGGGAGMGGGLFVYDGNVTVNNVTFSNNQVIGGGGSEAVRVGGGKLGGGVGGKGGGGGAAAGTAGSNGGGTNPGTGGPGNAAGAGTGGGAGGFGGSGGGGGGGSTFAGKGGAGGFGGGGGGSGSGSLGNGGNGGFGGGGGNSNGSANATGGGGGFGAGTGRGGTGSDFRSGGFGGGKGGPTLSGGGAGMGGAIFVRSGNLTVQNSRFNMNTATGGTGSTGSILSNGSGLGGAIFALQTTTNPNTNNQDMPATLPTVRLRKNTFSSNTAANDAGVTNAIATGSSQDNDNLFGTQFQILNAIPTASNNTVAVAADSTIALTSAFPFTDADADDSLQTVKIVTAPTRGQLFNDINSNNLADGGEAVGSGADIAAATIANLKFRPIAGESGLNYANVQFQVSDGIDFSTASTLTINVTPLSSGGGGSGGSGGSGGVTGTPLPAFVLAKKAKTLTGTAGNDNLAGTNRPERIRGLKGNDRLKALNGNDLLDGGLGSDRLDAGAGNDNLLGQAGNDRLIGGAGTDILAGGAGTDTLSGGSSKDMFVFRSLAEGIDTITDFDGAIDVIDVRSIFAQSNFAGATLLARFQQFAQFVQVGANTELRIDADGSGAGTSFTTLAVLRNVTVASVGSGNVVIA